MATMFNAHISAARTREEAAKRLEAISPDQKAAALLAPKMRHLCIKLEGVPAAAATIIKQAMIREGGEAAVSSEAYHGKSEATDVLIMGAAEQINNCATALAGEAGGLAELSIVLPRLITAAERTEYDWSLPGKTVKLGTRPLIMGIINCTPDSFYDGGRHFDPEAAAAGARRLIEEGADVIDVGGESTRPGSAPVGPDEELRRVMPVVREIAGQGALVSIDTSKAAVAKKAVEAGASIINDVTALADPDMARVAADSGAGLILMHMLGRPETMQKDPRYDDLFAEIMAYLRERIDRAVEAGVSESAIMVDPGIGFGKTVGHNLELIRDLWRLKSLDRPVLLGPSNKSFIGKVLSVEADDRFEGTAAALVAGVLAGASALRVHEVAGTKRFIDMAAAIARAEEWDREHEAG